MLQILLISFLLVLETGSPSLPERRTSPIKVSEYPFKQNKKALKNMTVRLYTYFYNISLDVLKPTFFNIYNLPFLRSPNIGKIRVKVGPKTKYFLLLYELLHQQN